MPPARYQPHPLIPFTQEETRNLEKRSNTQDTQLNCLGLCSQNSGLRDRDLEPSPERHSDKTDILRKKERKQQKTRHIVQPGVINETQALRELNVKPRAIRGTHDPKPL